MPSVHGIIATKSGSRNGRQSALLLKIKGSRNLNQDGKDMVPRDTGLASLSSNASTSWLVWFILCLGSLGIQREQDAAHVITS